MNDQTSKFIDSNCWKLLKKNRLSNHHAMKCLKFEATYVISKQKKSFYRKLIPLKWKWKNEKKMIDEEKPWQPKKKKRKMPTSKKKNKKNQNQNQQSTDAETQFQK